MKRVIISYDSAVAYVQAGRFLSKLLSKKMVNLLRDKVEIQIDLCIPTLSDKTFSPIHIRQHLHEHLSLGRNFQRKTYHDGDLLNDCISAMCSLQ